MPPQRYKVSSQFAFTMVCSHRLDHLDVIREAASAGSGAVVSMDDDCKITMRPTEATSLLSNSLPIITYGQEVKNPLIDGDELFLSASQVSFLCKAFEPMSAKEPMNMRDTMRIITFCQKAIAADILGEDDLDPEMKEEIAKRRAEFEEAKSCNRDRTWGVASFMMISAFSSLKFPLLELWNSVPFPLDTALTPEKECADAYREHMGSIGRKLAENQSNDSGEVVLTSGEAEAIFHSYLAIHLALDKAEEEHHKCENDAVTQTENLKAENQALKAEIQRMNTSFVALDRFSSLVSQMEPSS